MTPAEQINEINVSFNEANLTKFLAGQAEHGGDFFAKPTVDNIHAEVVDLVNYTHVLKKHKEECLSYMNPLLYLAEKTNPTPEDNQDLITLLQKLKQQLENL